MNNDHAFHVGLCMAGSISAGAYTAGVLDALFEALEQWENVREGGLEKNIPQHRVMIDVFSGASGGGMCGVISSLALQDANPYVGHHTSRLYQAWVEMNDTETSTTLQQMLGDEDAKREEEIKSIFYSGFIDKVADRSMDTSGFKFREKGQRPWVSENLDVIVTASNLRGLPYKVYFGGSKPSEKHTMFNHKLQLKFTTDPQYQPEQKKVPFIKKEGEEAVEIERNIYPTDKIYVDFEKGLNLEQLKNAALITGAFPFGLEPRMLEIERELLENIPFEISELQKHDAYSTCKKILLVNNPPDWGNKNFFNYETVCVDGGMTNNEPFEIARQMLLKKGDPKNNMPRDAELADRAIMLIDPFPDNDISEGGFEKPKNLLGLTGQILKVLLNQPLFKIEDIELAQQDDVFSRFLLIPTRYDEYHENPIACGSLGGFGGFFKKSFREHDFQLGRYNARRFLLYHFGLPEEVAETNPVFKGCWTEEAKQKWRYYDKYREKWMLPLVPILDKNEEDNQNPTLDKNLKKIPYPSYTEEELKSLKPLVWNRFKTIVKNFIRHRIKNKLKEKNVVRKPLSVWFFVVVTLYFILLLPFLVIGLLPLYLTIKRSVLKKLLGAIRENFTAYNLMKSVKKK